MTADLITDEAIDLAATTYLHMVPHCAGCQKASKLLLRRCEDCKRLAGEFAAHMLHASAHLIAKGALEQAADDWQRGGWANAPRRADRVQERIANGQHVGNWLRARAASQTTTTEETPDDH